MQSKLRPQDQDDLQWYFSRAFHADLGARGQSYEVLGTGTSDAHAMHVEPRTRLAIDRARRIEDRVTRLANDVVTDFLLLFYPRKYPGSLPSALCTRWAGREHCLAGLARATSLARRLHQESQKNECLLDFLMLEFGKNSEVAGRIKQATLARLDTICAAYAAVGNDV